MDKKAQEAIRKAGLKVLSGEGLPPGVKIVGGFYRVGGARSDGTSFEFKAEKNPGDREKICPPSPARTPPTIEAILTVSSTAPSAGCFGRLIAVLRSLVRSVRAAGAGFLRGKT